MKTITGLLIIFSLFVLAHSVIGGYLVKQDYKHCMTLYQDAAITDADITALVRQCELSTGYTLKPELMP